MSDIGSRSLDTYLKKTVDLPLHGGSRLRLSVSQTLFSSHQVDIGTMHLLKSLQDTQLDHAAEFLSQGRKFLDLGCGYGPIGLALGRLNEASIGHLVDRDALAVDFAQHNARLNGITNVEAYGSLGYDNVVERDFDLIASNIPGKAGEPVIRALLLDAGGLLSPRGFVAIVAVLPLEAVIYEILATPGVEILFHQTTSAHAVFHYRFAANRDAPTPGGFEQGLYDREDIAFIVDELTLPMVTVRGLAEFDTLSYESELMIKALEELTLDHVQRAAVFNPGQGHIPVLLWRIFSPEVLDLVDRDLLSLRAARLNLASNGCSEDAVLLHHQVALTPAGTAHDLVVGVLREDEGPQAIESGLAEAAEQMQAGGFMLIAGTSTPVTRVLKSQLLNGVLRTVKRKRQRGCSTVLFQRR